MDLFISSVRRFQQSRRLLFINCCRNKCPASFVKLLLFWAKETECDSQTRLLSAFDCLVSLNYPVRRVMNSIYTTLDQMMCGVKKKNRPQQLEARYRVNLFFVTRQVQHDQTNWETAFD